MPLLRTGETLMNLLSCHRRIDILFPKCSKTDPIFQFFDRRINLVTLQDLIQIEEADKLPLSNVDDRVRGGTKYAQVGKDAPLSLLKSMTDS